MQIITSETQAARRVREMQEAVAYRRFPLHMTHPDKPAIIVDDAGEEAEMRSQGYAPTGNPSAEGWQALLAGVPSGYRPVTWPMYVVPEGRDRMDGVIVEDGEAYESVMGHAYGADAPASAPPKTADTLEPNELAEFHAWKASRGTAPASAPSRRESRAKAFALAKERGVKVAASWSTEKIIDAIEAAPLPVA